MVAVRSGALLACVTSTACGFEPGRLGGSGDDARDTIIDDNTVSTPWLAGYGFRKPITITPPALGGNVTSFPVAVVLASDGDLAANAADDATDLVVTTSDGMTVLDREVAAFDGDTGRLELWVRVPTLELTGSRVLFLYYGGVPAAATASSVWPAPFVSVWHLGGDAGETDSAAIGNHLVVDLGDTAPAAVEGIAGGARAASAATDRLTHDDDDSLDFPSTSFSFSLWVKETQVVGAFDMPFYKGGTNDCCIGYSILLGTADWAAKVHDGGENNQMGPDYQSASFGDHDALAPAGKWIHLAAVVDRTAQTLSTYTNGAFVESTSIADIGPLASNQDFTLGGGSAGSWFAGAIDEARVYSAALSPAWFAVEHANLTEPGFISLGAQQAN